jgi:hypothetical protein
MFKGFISSHKDIVHVNSIVSRVDLFLEGVIHKALEGCRGIAESEEHYYWFEESSLGFEGGFPLIFFNNGTIVVSPSYVELSKPLLSSELVGDILYERKWILTWYHPFIKLSVVLYWS